MALWMLILLSVQSEVKFNSPDVEMNKNVSIRNRTLLQVYIELKIVPGGAFGWSRQTKLAIFSIKGHNSVTIKVMIHTLFCLRSLSVYSWICVAHVGVLLTINL